MRSAFCLIIFLITQCIPSQTLGDSPLWRKLSSENDAMRSKMMNTGDCSLFPQWLAKTHEARQECLAWASRTKNHCTLPDLEPYIAQLKSYCKGGTEVAIEKKTEEKGTTPVTQSQGVSCSTITDEKHPSAGPCKDARAKLRQAQIMRGQYGKEYAKKYYEDAAAAFRVARDYDESLAALKEMIRPTKQELDQVKTEAFRLVGAAEALEKAAKQRGYSLIKDCADSQMLYRSVEQKYNEMGLIDEAKDIQLKAQRAAKECKNRPETPQKVETGAGKGTGGKGAGGTIGAGGEKFSDEQCGQMKTALAAGEALDKLDPGKDKKLVGSINLLRGQIAQRCK